MGTIVGVFLLSLRSHEPQYQKAVSWQQELKWGGTCHIIVYISGHRYTRSKVSWPLLFSIWGIILCLVSIASQTRINLLYDITCVYEASVHVLCFCDGRKILTLDFICPIAILLLISAGIQPHTTTSPSFYHLMERLDGKRQSAGSAGQDVWKKQVTDTCMHSLMIIIHVCTCMHTCAHTYTHSITHP